MVVFFKSVYHTSQGGRVGNMFLLGGELFRKGGRVGRGRVGSGASCPDSLIIVVIFVAIVLSFLRLTDSDCPFGIFKLFVDI